MPTTQKTFSATQASHLTSTTRRAANFMKYIYSFLEGHTCAGGKAILGGKGHGLARMTGFGLPVPPGFTITTEACAFYAANNMYPHGFLEQFEMQLRKLERAIGKRFGDAKNPLLISVRSGAAVSMPGMMDTVLNLGLNDETVDGLAQKTGNERFCYDSYRRFINMFGNVVLGINHEKFEHALNKIKLHKKVTLDTQLNAEDLKNAVSAYKRIVEKETGTGFPADPMAQLQAAVLAVFKSWNNPRAAAYRRIHNITGLLGTAVNVQAMVFGNMGNTSGTGVLFTRNPSTGTKELYGEFLINAQGEDVVAGIRTPEPIADLQKKMPKVYAELVRIKNMLETKNEDMQDIEFTVEEGKLFILQTRNGKRTGQAAVKIAVDMVKEKKISKKKAILNVAPNLLNQLLHPSLDPAATKKVIARGLPASPGAACGRVVFSAEKAVEWAENGEKVILVRKETSPEDIQGMHASFGILTAMGGMTSHAAVVARGMGKPCVAGCSAISVDEKSDRFTAGAYVIKKGDTITLDGATGEVMLGTVAMKNPELSADFKTFMRWTDEYRTLKVRANADTPHDAEQGRAFGAEGIGLCRTEHMFFNKDRIPKIRRMILTDEHEEKKKALAELLPMQEKDFYEIFKVMDGLPVTIRLLDPPLHEFLPQNEKQLKQIAREMRVPLAYLQKAVDRLHEINPMLGHRGCRLAVTHPEIYEMQVHAIMRAAFAAHKKGIIVHPEIEIPLINSGAEIAMLRKNIEDIIQTYGEKIPFPVEIGTMIELPRACLTGDEIAPHADFFSFGTNDLTQCTFGYSRDDAGKFLPRYLEMGLLQRDPAESIDQNGVGELMRICVEKGRKVKPNLTIGICGEHGGEPDSVRFCYAIGLDFVSCSPYRVPLARLAAAQAAILKS